MTVPLNESEQPQALLSLKEEKRQPADVLEYLTHTHKKVTDDSIIPANDRILQNIDVATNIADALERAGKEKRRDSDSHTRNVIGRSVVFSFLAIIALLSISAIAAAFANQAAYNNIIQLVKEVTSSMSGIFGAILGYFFAKESDA